MPNKTFTNLPYELFMLLVCLMALGVLSADAGEVRVWKTVDGIYKTEAEFVEIFEDGKTVTLRRKNGTEFPCAIDTLSKKDQEYIKSQSEIKKSNPVDEVPDEIPIDAVVPLEDAAKDGEFGVDVWGDVVEETAKKQYQKQKDDYAPYLKLQQKITAKKKEVDTAKNRYDSLFRQYMKLPYSSKRRSTLSDQVDTARDKQWALESELRELEYSRPLDWRIRKPPQEPDASLLQKKVKTIIGTVRAEFVHYADDGMVTYRIKEEEKKTHIREMTSGDMDRIIVERLKRPIDKKFFQSDVIKKQVEFFIAGADSEGFEEKWKKLKWTPQEINRIVVFLLLYQLETERKYDLASPCFRGTLYELLKEKTSAARAEDCPKDVFALMACVQKAFLSEAEKAGKMNLAKITELNKEAETLEKTNKNDPKILLLRDQAKTLQAEDAAAAAYYRHSSEKIDEWKPLFNHWSAHRYDEVVRDAKPAKSYDNKKSESEFKDLFQ
jgi:hypothetical protein